MTILIANIGKSDLAVKPKKINCYLPIGFDRKEPNESLQGLSPTEKKLWESRERYIAKLLCKELGVTVLEREQRNGISYEFNFRELTKKILDAYLTDPSEWENRLRPGRIGGVLLEAKNKYKVKDVYVFVTDQNPPQPGDSIYLFEILDRWTKRKNWDLTLHRILLDPTKRANDQDLMLDEYYRFFRKLSVSEEILVSIKGGTPQMTTAIKVQTFSASVRQHLFLDPLLDIKKLLDGEYSSCQPASYWQYRRSQKYQTVQLLLNRWDFDGASQVLQDWQKTVEHLIGVGVVGTNTSEKSENANISQHKAVIESANAALKMAVGYLNLDRTYAETQASSVGGLADLMKSYNHQMNLYTQCCLFWQVDRIADFLTRMGSFYEETLHELIRSLGREQYFDRQRYPDDWYLDTKKLLSQNHSLAQEFYRLEGLLNFSALASQIDYQNCLENGIWQTPIKASKKKPGFLFKLPGRLTKRNFVAALVYHNNAPGNEKFLACQEMIKNMQALDYWCAKRNQLIHGAKGVSKLRMQEALKEDRQLVKNKQMKNEDIKNTVPHACDANQILTQMARIAGSTLTLMGTTQPPSAMYPDTADYLDPNQEPYYLYSDIRQWVIDTLDSDV